MSFNKDKVPARGAKDEKDEKDKKDQKDIKMDLKNLCPSIKTKCRREVLRQKDQKDQKDIKMELKILCPCGRFSPFRPFVHPFSQKKSLSCEATKAGKKNLAATYSPTLLCVVPSAMKGLTSEFGMGSGISPSLLPPGQNFVYDLIQVRTVQHNPLAVSITYKKRRLKSLHLLVQIGDHASMKGISHSSFIVSF